MRCPHAGTFAPAVPLVLGEEKPTDVPLLTARSLRSSFMNHGGEDYLALIYVPYGYCSRKVVGTYCRLLFGLPYLPTYLPRYPSPAAHASRLCMLYMMT